MRWDFMDYLLATLMTVLIALVVLILGVGVYQALGFGPKCTVWSEEKVKHGFIVSGKVTIPTTYLARDCVVYESKE